MGRKQTCRERYIHLYIHRGGASLNTFEPLANALRWRTATRDNILSRPFLFWSTDTGDLFRSLVVQVFLKLKIVITQLGTDRKIGGARSVGRKRDELGFDLPLPR